MVDSEEGRNGECGDNESCGCRTGFSRRSFMKSMGISAAATAAGGAVVGTAAFTGTAIAAAEPGGSIRSFGPSPFPVRLSINGQPATIEIDGTTTLLDALRWRMNLTGPKSVCDRGACGACSVLLDGQLVTACMILAIDAVGREVTTVEGLCTGEDLDPVQAAFVRHDAAQCGFCTPGLVIAGRALLNANPRPSLEQIKAGLSGNLCRCGTYTNVFNALLEASGQTVPSDLA